MAEKDKYVDEGDGYLLIDGKRFNYEDAREYIIKNTWPGFDAVSYIAGLLYMADLIRQGS
jgi:hypothetical protein